MLKILQEEAGRFLAQSRERYDLVYIDPPFNTGKVQRGRMGAYDDRTPRYIYLDWLQGTFQRLWSVIKENGSLFVHLDERASHYAKVGLDQVFGQECFQNEIIWAYDYGARSKKRWSAKHDSIFWYSKHPTDYTFNYEEMDRIPYMAPGLVGKEKAARGKTPTDVWWHTIVPTNGKERIGYPTQKPLGVLERIVKVHSNPGDLVLDCFAGSGTTGEACTKYGRDCVLVDESPEAISVMEQRLQRWL